ncbi:ParA family protein [Marivirga arenosa]|uniref:ParA family protein n=1 Tax=Marivirga arenosa TaxID=3059076 RepID=A0AA49JD27_9BACT|nr:ParA family protein [Marivirga sp. BKB1-2]WKK81614.1 ParA family protein [Marivirga sp. BKB1-2]
MKNRKIISIVNHKGGSGKTTTAVNMGVALSIEGFNVLLVDWDPQANLSYSFGIDDNHKPTLVDLFYENSDLKEVTVSNEFLDILPSNIQLADLEYSISKNEKHHDFLSDLLKNIKGYDYILIDCPPSLSILTLNALYASDEVIIPAQMEVLSVKGIELILNTIQEMKLSVNPQLKVAGILCMMVDKRRSLNSEIHDYIKTNFQVPVFEEVIRTNVRISEAPSFGESVITYSPKSAGAIDYTNFIKEYLKRTNQLNAN